MVFGTQDLTVEGGTNVTPKGGVTTDANNLLRAIPGVAELGMKHYEGYKQAEAEANNRSLLSQMSAEFMNINNQIDKTITSPQASAAKRMVMLKYLNKGADPTSVKAIMAIGFGGEEAFESEETKLENNLIDKASGLGLIYAGQSREEKLESAKNMVRSERYKYDLEEANKELTYNKGLMEYEKAYELENARRATLGLSVTETVAARDRITQVLRDFGTGKYGQGSDAISAAGKELDKIQAEFNATLGQVSKGQPELVEALFAPIKMTMEMARKQVVDGYNAESWNTYTNNAIAFQSNLMAQNPRVATLAAVSKLIPSYATTPEAARLVVQYIGPIEQNAIKGMVKPADVVVTDAEVAADPKAAGIINGYVTPTIQATKKAIENKDEQAVEAFSKQINGILNSVGVHGTGDPKDHMRIVQALANADMAAVVNGLGNSVNPENKRAAQEAVKSYGLWAINNISKNYEREMIGDKPVIEVAKPVLVNSSSGPRVELRPREGVSLSVMQNKALRAIERRSAKVLGDLVRAGAHLEGNTNYEAFFNANYTRLFGEKQDDKAE